MADSKKPAEPTNPMERLIAVAEDQLRWQKAAVLPQVRQTIRAALNTEAKRQAYELHDGARQSAEIAKVVGTSKQNLSGWTREWRDLGIAYEVPVNGGRCIKHLASLRSLGLDSDPEKDV
jgi:hypothetical protein